MKSRRIMHAVCVERYACLRLDSKINGIVTSIVRYTRVIRNCPVLVVRLRCPSAWLPPSLFVYVITSHSPSLFESSAERTGRSGADEFDPLLAKTGSRRV